MYNEATKWVTEATRCIARAAILRKYSPTDYSGAIEALQHCFELSCKSRYLLVGEKYPFNHNPAKTIDKVSEKLFSLYPISDEKLFKGFTNWMKDNGSYLAKLHHLVIYGDEEKKVPASKMFTKENVSELTIKVSSFFSYTYFQQFYIGHYFGYVSEEEYQEFLEFSTFIIKHKDKLPSLNEDEVYRLFPFMKDRINLE